MLIVKVKKGNIDRALKEYKSKVIKTRQMSTLRDLEEYEKPSATKRKTKLKAKYKDKKRREEDY